MKRCQSAIVLSVMSVLLPCGVRADEPQSTAAPAQPAPPAVSVSPAPTKQSRGGGASGGRLFSFSGSDQNGVYSISSGGVNISGSMVDRPAIISTQPMDAQTQTQFKEDLNIMDNLIRHAVAHTSGEVVPKAMGIRLWMLGNAPPMYVEGCGTIFSASLNVPLIVDEKQPDKEADPAQSGSAWEHAKAEVEGARRPVDRQPWQSDLNATSSRTTVKLDQLVDALLKALPEAKNIRALGPDESVIVTVSSSDESGAPLRLTMKAKKSDIDAMGTGKITADEFKQRVARRVG